MNSNSQPVDVGVIGVGSMGQHHARVYRELPTARLVGVADADAKRAEEVASAHGVEAFATEQLLDAVEAVTVAVPTEYHYAVAMECIDADVAMLIEKPLVGDLDRARELKRRIDRAGITAQVGHVERFNPGVMKLREIIEDLSLISLRAHRLGPEPERRIADSAVIDLMIHDLDVLLWLLDHQQPLEIQATGVDENRHATALLQFRNGVMALMTASRKTQRKVRRLEVIAEECYIEVDYLDQSIEIHRDSVPEYIADNGGVRFVHDSVIERPRVETGEPLRKELESFVSTVATGSDPVVSVEDGIEALRMAEEIEVAALDQQPDQVIADD